ncbi:MAG: MFS transporter [Hyphomicrobiales bacterium]
MDTPKDAPNMASTSRPASWSDLLTRDYAASLFMVCMGVWLHAADSLLVATMIPAIVAEIGGARLIFWTVALYDVGSIVAGVTSGLLAYRYGIRLPMVIAAGIFAGGCLISAVAPNMNILLIGRLFQGLGGGCLTAISFVAIGTLFPKHLMARAMGAISTLWGVSAFLGPLIGGLFAEHLSWRGGFLFFAVQAIILTGWLTTQPNDRANAPVTVALSRFPMRRLILLSTGILAIAFGGSDISFPRTGTFVVVGLTCLFLFLRLDTRSSENRLLPANPLGFGNSVSSGLTMILCFAAATIAFSVYGTLLVTKLHGLPILAAGYIMALEAIAWSTAAAILSGLHERKDPKMIFGGICVVAISIAGFAYSVPYGPVWMIVVSAGLQGVGFGMAWTFILRRMAMVVKTDDRQRVAAAVPTVQRIGFALGAVYIGMVANASGIDSGLQSGNLEAAAQTIFLASLPLAAIGLFAAWRFVRA